MVSGSQRGPWCIAMGLFFFYFDFVIMIEIISIKIIPLVFNLFDWSLELNGFNPCSISHKLIGV